MTQTGAQRIEHAARRAAVDILKSGGLGKVIEVHIAFGGGALAGGFYFADGKLGDPVEPPSGFDYNLWVGMFAPAERSTTLTMALRSIGANAIAST